MTSVTQKLTVTSRQELARELFRVRTQLRELDARNKELTSHAKQYLLDGLPVECDLATWVLQPSAKASCDTAILSDTRVQKVHRDTLATVSVTALKDLLKHGLVPQEVYDQYVSLTTDHSVVEAKRG